MKRRLGLVALLAAAACIDFSLDPDEVVAIEFAPLKWPAIVQGDTLRDEQGFTWPLQAQLYEADGDIVTGAPIEFLPDTNTVRLVAGDFLVAEDDASGSVRLRASSPGLQSIVRQLEIVRRPDSLAREGSADTLRWAIPDDPVQNTSVAMGGRVLSLAADTVGVRSWVVTFSLEVNGALVAADDTSGVFLVAENGRPSYADTTNTTGSVSRRVRVRVSPGFTPPDSVVVTVIARHRGQLLAGSPVTWVLPLRPR